MTGITTRTSELEPPVNKSEIDLYVEDDQPEERRLGEENKIKDEDQDEDEEPRFPKDDDLAITMRYKLRYALQNTLRRLLAVWVFQMVFCGTIFQYVT